MVSEWREKLPSKGCQPVSYLPFALSRIMTDDQEKICQLIIRQRPTPGPELDRLLQALQAEFGLDTYTARQRLLGPGLAMFGKGSREKTAKIAGFLRQYGYACWLVPPLTPLFAPDRLRGLEIHQDSIRFDCQKGPVQLERGDLVVAVLADLSGGLSDKHVKRLLAQNTYRGRDALQVLSRDEMVQAIYKGQPVFDFYLLDDQGGIRQAVRVLPGRFNIEGLGARAGMSTVKNLQAMLSLVEEYAGSCRIHYDFGLSQLPKCQIARQSESPSATIENLDSLTRYGWLVTRLSGDGLPSVAVPPDEADLVAGIAAAAVIGQPALGAAFGQGGSAEAVPGLGEVTEAIRSTLKEEQTETSRGSGTADSASAGKSLPPPPELPAQGVSLRRGLTVTATVVGVILLILVSEGHVALLRPVAHYGMAAGVFPGLLSIGLFWGGFYFIRLKRRVENTPTSKVRSIAMGMVEVHGRASRMYALVAPMTQAPCVFYRLRKYRRDRNEQWKLVREVDSRHVPFQVDDGTGRVTVDPAGASVRAKTRQSGYPGQSPLTFTAFNREYENEKWIEDIIYEGTSLYVLGYARPLKEERLSLRERTTATLRDLKLDPRAMHRYDTDDDGQISEAEWNAARSDAEQIALQEHLAERNVRKRQEEHVVIARPRQRKLPFVIAETVSEAHLTRKYGLVSIPLLIAGLAAFVFAVYKLLESLRF